MPRESGGAQTVAWQHCTAWHGPRTDEQLVRKDLARELAHVLRVGEEKVDRRHRLVRRREGEGTRAREELVVELLLGQVSRCMLHERRVEPEESLLRNEAPSAVRCGAPN